MNIILRQIESGKELKQFIKLPEIIHKGHQNWVPSIYEDDIVYFNRKKNRLFEHCDAILVLAFIDNKPIGRIMGIIHHSYNELHKEHDARFCFMECIRDVEVFRALIGYIESWAKSKGMIRVVGPLGFSDKDPQGFMIEGFDEPMVISTNGNLPFMPEMIVDEGYKKKVDCVVYKLNIPDQVPPFYMAIYSRVVARNKIRILEFTSRRQIRPFVRPVLNLLNETFADIYAFIPFDEKEMDDFANRYLLLLDPQFIKVITDLDGNVLSFIIAMPDISKGIIAAKGKLLPFGILKIIYARKKSKQLDLLLGGIKKEFRGKGLDVVMGVKMLESAQKRKMLVIDSHLELEINTNMRMEMERMGGSVYKRYRIFERDI